jgi:hypothetical protein
MSADFEKEELLVLQSIYDDCISFDQSVLTYKDDRLTLQFYLPEKYPKEEMVSEFSINVEGCGSKALYQDIRSSIVAYFRESERESDKDGVLYQVIELARVRVEAKDNSHRDRDGDGDELGEDIDDAEDQSDTFSLYPTRTARTVFNSPNEVIELNIISDEPFTERRSTFQAHFSIVTSLEQVEAFRSNLLGIRRIARATHNILAYRFTDPTTGIHYHDYDDDGETAAGGRLAEVMRLMKAENVAVMVTRWYGGILLGPDRFKFINNAGRELLLKHGIGKSGKDRGKGGKKN